MFFYVLDRKPEFSSYTAVAGLVDLVNPRTNLPPGTPHVSVACRHVIMCGCGCRHVWVCLMPSCRHVWVLMSSRLGVFNAIMPSCVGGNVCGCFHVSMDVFMCGRAEGRGLATRGLTCHQACPT